MTYRLDADRKLVVVDACFAGSITRAPGSVPKVLDLTRQSLADSLWIPTSFITNELRTFELGESPLDVDDWSLVAEEFRTPRTHVQWGASTEDQKSFVRLESEISVFTDVLTQHLIDATGDETLSEIHSAVHDEVYAYSMATPPFEAQNPPLLGGITEFSTIGAFFRRR